MGVGCESSFWEQGRKCADGIGCVNTLTIGVGNGFGRIGQKFWELRNWGRTCIFI